MSSYAQVLLPRSSIAMMRKTFGPYMVEDLDGPVGDADIDEFTGQAVGGGIPVAVDLGE